MRKIGLITVVLFFITTSSIVMAGVNKGTVKGVLVSPSGAPIANEEVMLCGFSPQSKEAAKDLAPNQRIQLYDKRQRPAGVLWVGDNRETAILGRILRVRSTKTDRMGAFVLNDVPVGNVVISVTGYVNAVNRNMDCQVVPMAKGDMPFVITVTSDKPEVDVGKITVEINKQ